MTEFGLGLGYMRDLDVRGYIKYVKMAECFGYDVVFFSETIELLRSAIPALTAFALSTERIKLGATQIVRIRSPVVIAQNMMTLDELSNGRMFFALGACTESHSKRYSLEHVSPAGSLREHYKVIKKLVSGETVDFEGKYVKLKGVKISFKPIRPTMPILIAATSKTGMKIVGEIADGVLLNAVTSPEYCVNAIKVVKDTARNAGRDPEKLHIAIIVVTSVSNDRKEALDAVRYEVASKFDPIQIGFNAKQRINLGDPYVKEEDIPKFKKVYAEGGMKALMEAIPESYLTGLTACGTPKEVEDKIEEYIKAGIHTIIIRPATKDMAERIIKMFALRR